MIDQWAPILKRRRQSLSPPRNAGPVAGLTRIGQLTQFISRTVIIAYTTAVGILICTGQIGNLLGIERGASVSLPETMRYRMIRVLMFDFNHAKALLGLSSLVLLIFLRRARPNWPDGLIVLTLAGAATVFFPMKYLGVQLVLDLGENSGAVPLFSGFPFNAEGLALVPRIAPTAMAVALLGMLEAISIAKSLALKSGQQVDPNQELIGMGLGNLAAAACSAMPGSASFLRSAANFQSGGVTQLATGIGSFGVLVIVMLITPFLNYIPVATLAAYLVAIAARLFNLKQIAVARRPTRSDAAVFWVTLIAALFLQLDTAIYVGVSFSFVFFLNNVSTPSMAEYAFNGSGRLAAVDDTTPRNNPHVSIVHVDGDLFFGAADLFQERVCLMARDPQIRVVVLRMKNARNLDGSTVLTIEQLADHLRPSGRHLLISGIQGDVARLFKRSGLSARLGEENIFPAEENPTLATKKALLRAQQLIGSKLEVRLFYDSHRLPGAATA